MDTTFGYFHKYRRLVRRGLVKALTCRCGSEYVTVIGDDGDLALRCYGCDSKVKPGMQTINTVKAVVKEHFGD